MSGVLAVILSAAKDLVVTATAERLDGFVLAVILSAAKDLCVRRARPAGCAQSLPLSEAKG